MELMVEPSDVADRANRDAESCEPARGGLADAGPVNPGDTIAQTVTATIAVDDQNVARRINLPSRIAARVAACRRPKSHLCPG
jgi:hypothetical protein